MANDLNQCNFIGRLGKDPETRYTASGDAVTNFSIACGESWMDKKTNQKQEKTEWVNVVAWRRLGEVCGEYLKKGSQVMVTGKFTTEKWQDQQGNDRYSTKIIANNMQMLGGRDDNQAPAQQVAQQQAPQQNNQQNGMPPSGRYIDDDSIPF